MRTTRLALSVAIAVTALLAFGLFPGELHESSDPTVLESVFNNRLVVWAARLLLLSAGFVLAVGGAFVVLSILISTRDGDWLKRAGPFEVSETDARDLKRQLTYWRPRAAELEAQLVAIEDLPQPPFSHS